MKTILITGCSSGFGLATALHFLERDWRVIATMRSPDPDLLPASDRLHIVSLDVTRADGIAEAVKAAGPIDALVNNAGAGLMGALEAVPMDAARAVFEVNTFGTMAMTQAVLPGFRAQGSGVVVNVSSAVTMKPFPLLSAYTASKAAVDAFSEDLALEVAPFGIRVRLVMPGSAPETPFSASARARSQGSIPAVYADWAKQVFAAAAEQPRRVTTAEDVAAAVWQAVTDPKSPERIPADADAVALAARSRLTIAS